MRIVAMETNLGSWEPQGNSSFRTYKPPSWDAIILPNHITYLILATAVVFLALFAIIRHLITDLIHDLADFLFGEQPPEAMVNPWECKDKFNADWSPKAVPELEDLARAEQIQVVVEGNQNLSSAWVIPDLTEPRPSRTGPRVAFGKVI